MASTSEMDDTSKKTQNSGKQTKSIEKPVTRSTAFKGADQGEDQTPLTSLSKKRKIGSKALKAVKKGQQSTLAETYQKGTTETYSSHTSEEIPYESAKKGKSGKEPKPIHVDSLNVLSPTRLDFQGFKTEGLDVEKYFKSAQLMPL